jgi:hypothetical protein
LSKVETCARADVLPRFISQSGGFSAGGEPLRLFVLLEVGHTQPPA